jgi:endonuclease/exonuclease/phosphatase family metal-dependent hydrolase
MRFRAGIGTILAVVGIALAAFRADAETFRIATYNVENYLDAPAQRRHVKSAESRAKVVESIIAIKPDVVALQEMGEASALAELRSSLKTNGLELPFTERVTGYDTNIHVAILSRLPFIALRPHTNDDFLLDGRRFRVSRGFAEVEIQVNSNYSFTLIAAHLKSKRPIPQADEADLRYEEAKVLRERIDALFATNGNINLVVLGDLNDSKDSKSIKEIIGRGRHKLVDTRPAERNGDSPPANGQPRNISWTHYYAVEDTYARFDYILVSPGMAREWVRAETFIATIPNWGVGSDHRPLVVTFETEDK